MSTTEETKSLRCHDYTVGWICPLEIEFSAARYLLDEEHEHPDIDGKDKNQYVCGQVNGKKKNVTYNVVIGCFPSGFQGTVAAGALGSRMAQSFQALQLQLLVGIGGGVPSPKDIRLGDVVVAQPTGTHGGVVQYDLGKETTSGFKRKGILLPPPDAWLQALNLMKSDHRAHGSRASKYLDDMFEKYPRLRRDYGRPVDDVLYSSDYAHPTGQPNCSICNPQRVVQDRATREFPTEPEIHYGLVASGNAVMKNAEKRDQLSRELDGVDCFEMEAAGLMTDTSDFRCIVIRGVSDYADSHKNDDWHGYAAAAAAAVAKELLTYMRITTSGVSSEPASGKQQISTETRYDEHNPSRGDTYNWSGYTASGNARQHNGNIHGNVINNHY